MDQASDHGLREVSSTLLRFVHCWSNCRFSSTLVTGWAIRIIHAGCEYSLNE